MSDTVRARIRQTLVEYGVDSEHGTHSWRCHLPDRYGPCDCIDQIVNALAADHDAAVAAARDAVLDEVERVIGTLSGHTAYGFLEPTEKSVFPTASVGFTTLGDGHWIDKDDVLTMLAALRRPEPAEGGA